MIKSVMGFVGLIDLISLSLLSMILRRGKQCHETACAYLEKTKSLF